MIRYGETCSIAVAPPWLPSLVGMVIQHQSVTDGGGREEVMLIPDQNGLILLQPDSLKEPSPH